MLSSISLAVYHPAISAKIHDLLRSLDSTVGWNAGHGNIVPGFALPVFAGGPSRDRTGTIFIGLLNIAWHGIRRTGRA